MDNRGNARTPDRVGGVRGGEAMDYPYTVQICGRLDVEYSIDGETIKDGCELPEEFLPELTALLERIHFKYPGLS